MTNGQDLLHDEIEDLVEAADYIPDDDKAFIDGVALKMEGRLYVAPPEIWDVHKLWDTHCGPTARKGNDDTQRDQWEG